MSALTELTVEVVGKFDEAGDCSKLLYAPLAEELTYRRTRRYRFEYTGSREALEAFVRTTLVDEVSQEVSIGEAPALDGFLFHLDYGMKKGVLDLEKESVLNYYREIEPGDFEIAVLELATRVYVFGAGGDGDVSERFVLDIVNPAIHTWSIANERS